MYAGTDKLHDSIDKCITKNIYNTSDAVVFFISIKSCMKFLFFTTSYMITYKTDTFKHFLQFEHFERFLQALCLIGKLYRALIYRTH